MATEEEEDITQAILRSEVSEHLLLVRLDPRRANASARFRTPEGGDFTVTTDGTKDATPDSIAASLIAQARTRLAS